MSSAVLGSLLLASAYFLRGTEGIKFGSTSCYYSFITSIGFRIRGLTASDLDYPNVSRGELKLLFWTCLAYPLFSFFGVNPLMNPTFQLAPGVRILEDSDLSGVMSLLFDFSWLISGR